MILNIIDRMNIILGILPQKNTFEKMLLGRDIKNKLNLTPGEKELLLFKEIEPGKVSFKSDIAKSINIEIEFSDSELNLLKEFIINLKDSVTENLLDTIQVIKNENKSK